VAFLLAQLGAHAAARYAERVAALDLTPAQTGLLRLVALDPGMSQQALASRLGVVPSKVVALVDDLEGRELVERRRNPGDRRHHALHLTSRGEQVLAQVGKVAREHEADTTAGLDDDQRQTLLELLASVAAAQGLTPGVHPGYAGPRRPAR
jgi:DNA-binding MarR family transcriptional regulator